MPSEEALVYASREAEFGQKRTFNLMTTNQQRLNQARFQWLVRVGYGLMVVGLVLVLLRAALPIDFFTGSMHYYRVVPTEQSWFIVALPMGVGVLLILIARTLWSENR